MTDVIQVITTVSQRADAERIAHDLVEQQYAACVQIGGPITSYYRWEGKIESALEWKCVIKTKKENYAKLEDAIRSLHPYDVPEILATGIVAGNQSYLTWVDDEVVGD